MTVPRLPPEVGEPVSTRPLGGGSICDVWWAALADGRAVVVKRTPYDPEVEADGLEALRAAGAPVPAVLGLSRSPGSLDGASASYASGIRHGEGVLVLEHVTGPPDWAGLGRALAAVHGRPPAAVGGETFGWQRDNLIGTLHQDNEPHAHWPTFYAERRIRPLLDAPALPETLRRRLERALDGPLLDLLDHDPPPSLIHGDLWNGNVVDGRWLIDPAVHRADRELEMAFADLFGGLPASFTAAYEETWPLPTGWQRRRPALQLYHLLVHVGIFGAGYAGSVATRLDALGW